MGGRRMGESAGVRVGWGGEEEPGGPNWVRVMRELGEEELMMRYLQKPVGERHREEVVIIRT